MTDTMREIIRTKDNKFKYQLLDRMRSDCNYYLNAGGRHNKFLWSGTVKNHIDDMKALYSSFEESERPEWLSLEDIGAYYEKMKDGEKTDTSRTGII